MDGTQPDPPEWLVGGGEMGARLRAHDWAQTPLGPLETWPPRLRAAVALMLGMRQPVCLWWGAEPRLLYNDAYRTILGHKHPAALGRTLAEVWPELAGTVTHPLEVVRTQGPQLLVDREFALTTDDGEPRSSWFTSTWTPLHDETGAVMGTFNVSLETTGRVLAERALQAREAQQAFLLRLSDALRPLTDPVAIQEAATHLLGAHLAVDRTYYVEIDDARGVAVVARDYVRGRAASLVGEHPLAPFSSMLTVIRAGQTFVAADAETDPALHADRADYRARALRAFISVPLRKEGALVAALCVTSATPRRWTSDEVALVEETAERTWDAAERARAEAALRAAHATLEARVGERTAQLAAAVEDLRASEGRLRLLVEQMPAALWMTDLNLRLTALMGAAVPASAQAGLGQALPEFLVATAGHAAGVAAAVEAHRRALAGVPSGFEAETAAHTYAGHVEPLRDGGGQIVGTIGVAHDVTERALLRLQDEFLALASHELRTPLTPALGYLEMALATLEGATPARRYVARATEQVGRLNALVGDLLDVGRLRGGKMGLALEEIDLGGVVRRGVETAEVAAGAQGQAITLEAPEEAVPVHGDALRLEQVVLNLLTNALTYAARSPTIAVQLRQDRTAGQAVLEVQDAGPGIAVADLPHLFSRFYQVERPDRPSRGGLGLGLYLVQQLVEAHGGTVGVTSTVGHGTTFTVRLPLRERGHVAGGGGAGGGGVGGGGSGPIGSVGSWCP